MRLLATAHPRRMAASTGTLTGIVTDHTGKHLRWVYVTIRGTDRFATTDADGRYTLYAPAFRRYTVNYYKEGYETLRQAVILKEGETTVDVVLEGIGS